MAESDDSGTGFFRTRRSEVISGLSVASIIAVYGFLRSVVGDINDLIEAKNRAYETRIERMEQAFASRIQELRADQKESEDELKQRIIWIERALSDRARR